jgi:hypothetical protein
MIAVGLMSRNPMHRAPEPSTAATGRQAKISGPLQTDKRSVVTAEFRPLDAGVVNEAIPAFFIGRNMEGFWVARDVGGQIGGIFLLEHSALSFARRNSQPAGCATIFPSERFELDLENNGNPLVAQIGWFKRLATAGRQRIAVLIGHWTEAVRRRLMDFHVL